MTRAQLRQRAFTAAVFLAVVAGMYAGCAVAAAVTGYPVPVDWAVIAPVGWVCYWAIDGAAIIAAEIRAWPERRRRERIIDDYQIGAAVPRDGSPGPQRAVTQPLRAVP